MAVSQNEALLVAVFRQLEMKKLDYELLGRDLGLSRQAARKAARNRWVRFEVSIPNAAFSASSNMYQQILQGKMPQ